MHSEANPPIDNESPIGSICSNNAAAAASIQAGEDRPRSMTTDLMASFKDALLTAISIELVRIHRYEGWAQRLRTRDRTSGALLAKLAQTARDRRSKLVDKLLGEFGAEPPEESCVEAEPLRANPFYSVYEPTARHVLRTVLKDEMKLLGSYEAMIAKTANPLVQCTYGTLNTQTRTNIRISEEYLAEA